jgi:hypothetical protein
MSCLTYQGQAARATCTTFKQAKMKSFACTAILLLALAAGARADEVCGGTGKYSEIALPNIDALLVQTLPNLIIKQDFSLKDPVLRVFTNGEVDSVLSTSDDDGIMVVQPKDGKREDVCVHLVLNGQGVLDKVLVNDEALATFDGPIVMSSLYLQPISGSFFAPNTSQFTVDILTFNATGQGSGTFLHDLSAASELSVALSGNGNFTWTGGVGSGGVTVVGQGDVVLGPVLANLDVSLTGFGNVATNGSATALFTGEAKMPNTVQFIQGSCEVAPGPGAAPQYNPCVNTPQPLTALAIAGRK